jgi:AcrR family transcriptional regulator
MGLMSTSPRRGRPPLTSRDAILGAALEIGLDRATTSAVAARLGVDQSTLYRHVASRDDMLDAAVDIAASRAVWPDPGEDWAEYLRECARTLWEMFSSVPGLAQRLRGATSAPESLAAQAYRAVSYLHRRLGISVREAALIVDTIGDMTADSYLTVAALDGRVDGVHTLRDIALTAMDAAGPSPEQEGALRSEYIQALREAMGSPGMPSSWWLDKVELVIDGVRHRIEHGGA